MCVIVVRGMAMTVRGRLGGSIIDKLEWFTGERRLARWLTSLEMDKY